MRKQQGFTLIELVIVIVILGILAVTAAPKFLDLSSDARESTVRGLEGAIKGGINIVYSKAAIDGQEATDAVTLDVTGNGASVDIAFGYPDANAFSDAQRNNWIDISGNDWTITPDPSSPLTAGAAVTITPVGYTAPTGEFCQVVYTPNQSSGNAGDTPTVVATTDGC